MTERELKEEKDAIDLIDKAVNLGSKDDPNEPARAVP